RAGRVEGRAARARARRAGAPARSASVLLEEREVGSGARAPRPRRGRLLGNQRVTQPRGPLGGTEVLERLETRRAPLTWRVATVARLQPETPSATTLILDVLEWPGHLAGQHIDVRLTAEDGYQAERSYSIASAPQDPHLAITIERIDDGEVSPYLTDELRPGDQLELRGPIGGYFTWEAADGGPLLLLAGGSGLVPLMATRPPRPAATSNAAATVLVSARSWEDVLFRDELATHDEHGVTVCYTLTREQPPEWKGW